MAVDFLAIGHITHDRTAEGVRLGGTVSYAAVTSRRLGRQPAILTRGSLNGFYATLRPWPAPPGHYGEPGGVLAGVEMHLLESPVSTTFTNIYRDGQRVQLVEAVAAAITPVDLPAAWANVPIVLLGPIAQELPVDWADAFPHALIGVSAQGWLRTWDAQGHVKPTRWQNGDRLLQRADVVFISREDVGGDDAALQEFGGETRLMVVTDGWRGSTVYQGGVATLVPPRLAKEVDPTGAGDVFAAAYLVRLAETQDPLAAARFANVVASFSVEAPGMAGIPSRAQAEAWLAGQADTAQAR